MVRQVPLGSLRRIIHPFGRGTHTLRRKGSQRKTEICLQNVNFSTPKHVIRHQRPRFNAHKFEDILWMTRPFPNQRPSSEITPSVYDKRPDKNTHLTSTQEFKNYSRGMVPFRSTPCLR